MSFDTLFYLALFAGALLLMTRFGCGAQGFGHFRRHGGQGRQAAFPAAGPGASPADGQTTDPVCGMGVERTAALSAEHDGETYCFCSQPCLDKFRAAPAAFAAKRAPVAPPARHRHGCC